KPTGPGAVLRRRIPTDLGRIYRQLLACVLAKNIYHKYLAATPRFNLGAVVAPFTIFIISVTEIPTMNHNPAASKALSESARVDQASVQPFPGSKKVYVTGSRPDIRVPMRVISLSGTRTAKGMEKNSPVPVYDTSGPYTDPLYSLDLRKGLPELRSCWREARDDTEILTGTHSAFTRGRLDDAALAALRFYLQR